MRSILIGFWATSALASSMMPLRCHIDPDGQSFDGLCDRAVVTKCVSAYVESNDFSTVGQCLITGGCSEGDAALTSKAIHEFCVLSMTIHEDDAVGDLRKRQKNKGSSSAAAVVTDAKTTAADSNTSAAQTTADAQSSSDSPSAAPSTTDTPSSAAPSSTDTPSSTDSPSSSSIPASTTPSSASSTPSTSMTSTTSPTTSTTGTLVCLTTSQKSTTYCMTSTNGASTGSTCIPTFTAVISCVPGLICQSQAAGETSCMVRQNYLTTSGLVVTIIFATVLFAFFASLFGMCIKSRRTSRRQALEREAALIAGTKSRNMRDVEASNNYARGRMGNGSAGTSEDHLPLMAAQGPAGGAGGSRNPSADRRPTVHRIPSGSYQDVVASRAPAGAPRLHPGLMGMDADDDDDIAYRGGRGGR